MDRPDLREPHRGEGVVHRDVARLELGSGPGSGARGDRHRRGEHRCAGSDHRYGFFERSSGTAGAALVVVAVVVGFGGRRVPGRVRGGTAVALGGVAAALSAAGAVADALAVALVGGSSLLPMAAGVGGCSSAARVGPAFVLTSGERRWLAPHAAAPSDAGHADGDPNHAGRRSACRRYEWRATRIAIRYVEHRRRHARHLVLRQGPEPPSLGAGAVTARRSTGPGALPGAL